MWIRGHGDSLARNGPVLLLVVAGLLAGLASMLLVARSVAAPMTSVRAAVRAVEHGATSVDVTSGRHVAAPTIPSTATDYPCALRR